MEPVTTITALQKRIEEQARERLLKDMWEMYQKQCEIKSLIKPYPEYFTMRCAYPYYNGSNKDAYNISAIGKGLEIFDNLLPNYIQMVTDEILVKIKRIDFPSQNEEF